MLNKTKKMSYYKSFLIALIVYFNPYNPFVYGLSPAPTNIYVGSGYFSGEYYNFYTDSSGSNSVQISDFVFYKGNIYTFHKISGTGHPFT